MFFKFYDKFSQFFLPLRHYNIYKIYKICQKKDFTQRMEPHMCMFSYFPYIRLQRKGSSWRKRHQVVMLAIFLRFVSIFVVAYSFVDAY